MKQFHSYISTLILVATTLMGSCTTDDSPSNPAATNTIAFSAHVENLHTRAEKTGCMDYLTLSGTGFGVFGYNSAKSTYTTSLSPEEEFCGTQVNYTGTEEQAKEDANTTLFAYPNHWSYGTAKEWNEDDKRSFFAYAPYVTASDISAATCGITGIAPSSTAGTGDPTITYKVASSPKESVDLLWGINSETGFPWLNATAEETGGNIHFTFFHALAAIGFHVQAIVDQDNNLTDLTDQSNVAGLLGTNCKVTLKSIQLYQDGNETGGFYTNGILNLNNATANTPNWTTKDGTTALTLSREDIDDALVDQGDKSPSDMTNTGITETANTQTVIAKESGKEQFFMLIPETESSKKTYTAKIEYYITYNNPNGDYTRLDYTGNDAGIATISNITLTAGIKYYLNFVIGLKTFKLNVTAEDWKGNPIELYTQIEHGTSANSSLAPRR